MSLPFFRDGIRLRTRFIDDFLRTGLGAGHRQIIILGAGFDSRGLRISEIAEHRARVYEVDTLEQLERKRGILASAGVTIPPDVAYVPFDFATPDLEPSLSSALEARGFRRGAGALFIWEGVIGYIDGAATDCSLRFMAAAGGSGSRLVFTFGAMSFAPDTALDRARRAGFSDCEELGMDDVWRRYLPGEPHPDAWVAKVGTAIV